MACNKIYHLCNNPVFSGFHLTSQWMETKHKETDAFNFLIFYFFFSFLFFFYTKCSKNEDPALTLTVAAAQLDVTVNLRLRVFSRDTSACRLGAGQRQPDTDPMIQPELSTYLVCIISRRQGADLFLSVHMFFSPRSQRDSDQKQLIPEIRI